MIIGLVTDRIWPFYEGGYERRYWNLARELSQKHEVHVLTSCPRDEELGETKFHRIAGCRRYFNKKGYRILGEDFIYSLSLMKCLFRKERFDIIDCNATPFVHIPFARTIAASTKAKFVLTLHEVFKKGLPGYFTGKHSDGLMSNTLSKPLANLAAFYIVGALKMSDSIVSVSNMTKTSLQENFGIKDVTVIPNGVDVELFDSISATSTKQGCFRLATISRLVPEKRVADLIEAVRILIHRFHINVELNVLGDGPLRTDLVALCRKLDVYEAVNFHGFVEEIEKIELLKASDVFVLPSAREGFSISTLEAMAASLPTVVARPKHQEARGVMEIVRHRENGLLYPCGNPNLLAKSLQALLSDENLRTRLAQRAKCTAEAYDWSNIATIYEKMIAHLSHK